MGFASFLGLIGTLVDLVRTTPQLSRLMRVRKSFGVSVDATGTSCIVSLAWTIYGVVTQQAYVILASGLMTSIFLILTLMALRLGRSAQEFRVAPIWLGILFAAGVAFGENGLGAVLSVSALASNLPQIRVAYMEENLSGLSLTTWVLTLSSGLIWALYGVLQQDISILISAFLLFITSGVILTLKISRQLKDNLAPGELS